MPDEDLTKEIVIEVPRDGAAAEGTPSPDSPELGIDDLKRQLEAERAGRAAEVTARTNERAELERRFNAERAERERIQREAGQHVSQARTEVSEAQYDSVTNALSAAEREGRELATQQAKFLADGEFDKAGEIGLRLAEIGGRLNTLRTGKAELDAQRAAPKPAAVPERQAQPTEDQARESWLARQNPANAGWIRAHPQFFTDQQFQQKAIAASQYATSVLGMQPGAADYTAHIEQAVGLRPAVAESLEGRPTKPAAAAPATPAVRTAPAAAPSRDNPTGRPGDRVTSVTLTPEERQHARQTLTPDIIGVGKDPEVVFAQHKAKMLAEGKWRSTSDTH